MSLFTPDFMKKAENLLQLCLAKQLRVATAESCTGGLVAGLLTEIPGSSQVIDRGFVTYDNGAKVEMLGVSEATLAAFGAVSAEIAREMAAGALERSPAQLAVAITGVAGPGGGSPAKPVGLVHFAARRADAEPVNRHEIFKGDRTAIRLASVGVAIAMLSEMAALPD